MSNEKRVINWSVSLEVRSKEQYEHIIDKISKSDVGFEYTVEIERDNGQIVYNISIHNTPWTENLFEIANIASEVDLFSEDEHLEPWSGAWFKRYHEEIKEYYERGKNVGVKIASTTTATNFSGL